MRSSRKVIASLKLLICAVAIRTGNGSRAEIRHAAIELIDLEMPLRRHVSLLVALISLCSTTTVMQMRSD